MNIFILPSLTFVLLFSLLYYVSNEKDKSKPKKMVKLLIPSVILSTLVFIIVKYKENIFHEEPIMTGNYFD